MSSTKDFSVEKWMQQDFQFVRSNDTITETVKLLIKISKDELPVLDGKQMIGIVKLTDCIQWIQQKSDKSMLVHMIVTNSINKGSMKTTMNELQDTPFYVTTEQDGVLVGIIDKPELFAFQKFLKQQLKESQQLIEWFRLSFDTAYEGIAIVDENGVIQMFNEYV
ncbi:hypothetical protein KOY_02454 [Bacillus cereus VDM021]|nr:CBS domain-containing protein [Bacillus cereus group sp. BfR-BA-01315]EOQ08639.1 hypothetical protein KOY_02454 [Bacillus cereus VDM021]